MTELSDDGWDIVMYEPFDYQKYLDEGVDYLYESLGQEAADWQIKNSNILEIGKFIPKFLQTVRHHKKNPSIKNIEEMVDNGTLVILVLNSRVLNKKEGYVSHSILIFDYDDTGFKFHDPGLLPQESRIEDKKLVMKAAGDVSDATGFKLARLI